MTFTSFTEADLGLLQHPRWSALSYKLTAEALNYYYKELHLGCYSSPRSASGLNNNTSNSERKIKATRLVKTLLCLFKQLECVVLGEVQVPNTLQYRFKIFSGTTQINANKTMPAFFLIVCRSLGIKYFFKTLLNDNSWHSKFTDFSKTAHMQAKIR